MTRKLAMLILALAAITGSAVAQAADAAPAAAPAATGSKVAIINIQEAIMMSNEGQRDIEALQKKFEPKQTELKNLRQEITDLQTQLTTQGSKMEEEARVTLAKNLDTKKKSFERSGEDASTEFQNESNQIVVRIGSKLMKTVEKYAVENGFGLILDVSSPNTPVLWAGASTNITEEIINAYNAESGVPAPARAAGAQQGAGARPATGTGAGTAKPAATGTAKPKPTGNTPR